MVNILLASWHERFATVSHGFLSFDNVMSESFCFVGGSFGSCQVLLGWVLHTIILSHSAGYKQLISVTSVV